MSEYLGRPAIGTIVHFWLGCHTNVAPQAAIIKKPLDGGNVALQAFDPENGNSYHHACVSHISNPGLRNSNNTLSPRATRGGCWDFIKEEPIEPKAEAKKAK